jgi:hypothetical protein
MAKVILEFDPIDDKEELDNAINGWKWSAAYAQMDLWLRNELKYNNELSQCQDETYEKMREKLREVMQSYGLTFE